MGGGMKLCLLIIGTILVYITVENQAKRLNGDIMEGKPSSLFEDNEGMVRVKRAVDGRRPKKQGGFRTGRKNVRSGRKSGGGKKVRSVRKNVRSRRGKGQKRPKRRRH